LKINLETNLYFCLHGHFYQPPRENPLTGEIEKQPSASPFHNWNERIYQECYKPNTEAVIVNNQGDVVNRINNYEYMNFNFGPTLLDWIRDKHPRLFFKILEADKKSLLKHNGHGNAIAQVYNHIIMTLANKKDKITQVKWGLKHFNFYFGRDSEGIWLSETACDLETLEVLADEGVKYTILDPSQAEKIRKFNSVNSTDVSDSSINPKIPFRCYLDSKKEKYIDIFFYDGPFAKSIAFDDMIYSAEKMLGRIEAIKIRDHKSDQLISAATDGETFGHHKHFTERTIAFLLTVLAPNKGYKVVNFGEYLAAHPPEYEVSIKKGIAGKGTSWSCVHGTGRWYEDCGCHTGGEPGWNQKWRTPLRSSLNHLRDSLSEIYETNSAEYFKDIWEARNNYIDILLDSSEDAKNDFFAGNAKNDLGDKEKNICIQLLEMQKYAMFMFTSCGWFFSDISGIETQQTLEYAKRALEISTDFTDVSEIEKKFLDELEKAKSNRPAFGNGKEIYLKLKSS
jgi:alpha-amylase/alpha-mannosidase (GH57 family)